MQVLRKEAAKGRWSWQQPGGSAGEERDMGPNAEPKGDALQAGTPMQPSWANGGRCAAGTGHGGGGCGCGVAEPTEAEYTAALGEARCAMQDAVTGINESLDELRQALADEEDA